MSCFHPGNVKANLAPRSRNEYRALDHQVSAAIRASLHRDALFIEL